MTPKERKNPEILNGSRKKLAVEKTFRNSTNKLRLTCARSTEKECVLLADDAGQETVDDLGSFQACVVESNAEVLDVLEGGAVHLM